MSAIAVTAFISSVFSFVAYGNYSGSKNSKSLLLAPALFSMLEVFVAGLLGYLVFRKKSYSGITIKMILFTLLGFTLFSTILSIIIMSKIDKETYPAASKMNMLAMILNIAMTVIISIISGLSIFKKKPILGRIQPIQTTISLKAPYNDPQGANIQLQQLRQGPETSQKPALPGTPRPFREKQGAMTLPTRSQ